MFIVCIQFTCNLTVLLKVSKGCFDYDTVFGNLTLLASAKVHLVLDFLMNRVSQVDFLNVFIQFDLCSDYRPEEKASLLLYRHYLCHYLPRRLVFVIRVHDEGHGKCL